MKQSKLPNNTLTLSNGVSYTGDLIGKHVILSPGRKVKGRIFAQNLESNGADCSEVEMKVSYTGI